MRHKARSTSGGERLSCADEVRSDDEIRGVSARHFLSFSSLSFFVLLRSVVRNEGVCINRRATEYRATDFVVVTTGDRN